MTHDMDAAASREVSFLEKLQRLLAEGEFTSTYKLAVLIGLTDLSAEQPPPTVEMTHAFTTRQLAEKVIRLYWPQVRPFTPDRGGAPHLLLQNRGGQAAIVSLITNFQQRALGGSLPPTHLDGLTRAHPSAWESLLGDVEWKLIEMPLPRLQTLPSGADNFIYTVSWTVRDVEPYGGRLKNVVRTYQTKNQSAFDNRIIMQAGTVNTMRRLRGIIRDLVEARWVLEVRNIDRTVREDHSLREHLFGLERRDLGPIRRSLVDSQRGACFYCGRRTRAHHVDHFLPHALSRVDFIENLVLACGACNTAKSAHLAGEPHVRSWLERLQPNSAARSYLGSVAAAAGWPSGPVRTLNLARLLYGQYPVEATLWKENGIFATWSKHDLLESIDGCLRRFEVDPM